MRGDEMTQHSTTAGLDPTTTLRPPTSGLPRLLRNVPAQGAMSLRAHLDTHGEAPSAHRRERRGAPALIELVEQAGLRGRGGGGFPTATKMRAVVAARGKPIVVVNATEGEPASLKDHMLLEALPHLVLDGAELAARAIGSEETIVCVCESAGAGLQRVARALEERRQLPGHRPRVMLREVPEGYVAGQESALVNYLNDGEPKPTFTPPMPFERGVRRHPTLVSNAETLAHIALIARHGPNWFRELGLPDQPGSMLVTLSGPVSYPGVYEVEHGAPVVSLIDAAGGTRGRVRAALFGGYAGTWVDGGALSSLGLSDAHLSPYGASLGAGVVLLLSEHACPIAETARVTRWLASQSAGQCGPCVHGLDALAETFERIVGSGASSNTAARIEQLGVLVRGRGACAHPDGTARFVSSATDVFADELADHIRYGTCEACMQRPELPLPTSARMTTAA